MASIFTYDPDPPRVASPWLHGVSVETDSSRHERDAQSGNFALEDGSGMQFRTMVENSPQITRLQAEPQEGPVEYKLHLLLRPRRKFKATSTGGQISGSKHSKGGLSQTSRSTSEANAETRSHSPTGTPSHASTQQTRQHRLEQLTTQLLWRLQQSSPHHTSSATNIILPSLPEALPELIAPQQLAKPLHGLEESQGALYEIGVSDDGTLVGLAEDEMQESLNNLRAMAGCLGCTVEILRRETVGECEWLEDMVMSGRERKVRRFGKLVVVEAMVKPRLQSEDSAAMSADPLGQTSIDGGVSASNRQLAPTTEQLRITLTGPTMSGKSTLLGTLTTSTLDNGRGKSRVSMLKHRHEITSGVTSSVTQELLGYEDGVDGIVKVVNYATENVASWIDIHIATTGSRLVFISDSAGHPRYRRTTIRGLVGWTPHYTLLCVPADDAEDPTDKTGSTQASQQALGSAVSDVDLAGVQLDLCLRLHIPLIVIVTKLDVASRVGLKRTLTKILDALKAAGRRPAIVPNAPTEVLEGNLQTIAASAIESAYHTTMPLLKDFRETVPIVFTSAVQGTGINSLHALLHELPIPQLPSEDVSDTLSVLFHIEDIYSKPAEVEDGIIVSGRLRSGRVFVGYTGVLGPFSVHHDFDDSEDSDDRPSRRKSSGSAPSSQIPTSRSFPGALRNTALAPSCFPVSKREWLRFRIVSIRNLRLPVHALEADQVGTLAIVPDESLDANSRALVFARVRKGMVLAPDPPPAAIRTFAAEFRREDLESLAVGNHVVVYVASVRASARVVSAQIPDSQTGAASTSPDAHDMLDANHQPFGFEDVRDDVGPAEWQKMYSAVKVAGTVTASSLIVTFRFNASKELIIVGDQILVMPGGGPGLYGGHERGEKGVAGLEGFVGKITEIFE